MARLNKANVGWNGLLPKLAKVIRENYENRSWIQSDFEANSGELNFGFGTEPGFC